MHVHKLRLEERGRRRGGTGRKGEFLPRCATSFLDSSPKWLLHVVDRNNAIEDALCAILARIPVENRDIFAILNLSLD